jgi:hypothetical protein
MTPAIIWTTDEISPGMPQWFTWADLVAWQRELFRVEPGKKPLTAICAHCRKEAVGSRRPRHAPNQACSGHGSGELGQRVFVRVPTANVVVPTDLTVLEAVKVFVSLLHQRARPDGGIMAGSLGEALRDARCVRVVVTALEALPDDVARSSVTLIAGGGAVPADGRDEFVLVDIDDDGSIAVWSAVGSPSQCVRLETFLALRASGMLQWNSSGHYEWDAAAPPALRGEVESLRSAQPRSAYLTHLDYHRAAQVVLHPEAGC